MRRRTGCWWIAPPRFLGRFLSFSRLGWTRVALFLAPLPVLFSLHYWTLGHLVQVCTLSPSLIDINKLICIDLLAVISLLSRYW